MWGIAQFCLLYLRCMWELMWPIRGERSAWECQSGCWWGMIPAWLSWHRRDTELSHERAKCRKKDSTGQSWEARSRNCNAGCRISLWVKTEIPDLAAASISGLRDVSVRMLFSWTLFSLYYWSPQNWICVPTWGRCKLALPLKRFGCGFTHSFPRFLGLTPLFKCIWIPDVRLSQIWVWDFMVMPCCKSCFVATFLPTSGLFLPQNQPLGTLVLTSIHSSSVQSWLIVS